MQVRSGVGGLVAAGESGGVGAAGFDEADADAHPAAVGGEGLDAHDLALEAERRKGGVAVGVAAGFKIEDKFQPVVEIVLQGADEVGAVKAEVVEACFVAERSGVLAGFHQDGEGHGHALGVAAAALPEVEGVGGEVEVHAFVRGPGAGEEAAGAEGNLVEGVVAALGGVVEEDEVADAGVAGQGDGGFPGAVAAAGGLFGGQELGVTDEELGATGELAETKVELSVAGLVVGGIDKRGAVVLEAVGEGAARVIGAAGADTKLAERDFAVGSDFLKIQAGPSAALGRRERHTQQGVDNAGQAARGPLRRGAVNGEFVSSGGERGEVRQALDMIPMVVAKEEVGVEAGDERLGVKFLAQRSEPGAGVEEYDLVGGAQFEGGGVAAVATCVGMRRGNRAANAPKAQSQREPPLPRRL